MSGAFDTARELRAMCEAAQCELRAHIGGTGASAAYALASAASWIGVSQTAAVGSIGIIDTLVDATEQNKMFGLNVQLVASGVRKADGNPDQPISEGAIKATQARVDEVAEMFFALVESHGWGSVDDLRALQGAVVTGEQAVSMGLASQVATLQQAIAFGSPGASSETTNGENEMPTPMEDAIKSLREAAESEDEEESKRAKAALAALDDSDDDDEGAQDDNDEPEATEEEEKEEEKEKIRQDQLRRDRKRTGRRSTILLYLGEILILSVLRTPISIKLFSSKSFFLCIVYLSATPLCVVSFFMKITFF